jgi:hypothetical protein
VNGPCSADENQERRLKCVVRIGRVAEHASTDAHDHRTVPGDERGKSELAGVMATGCKSFQQLVVGQSGRDAVLQQAEKFRWGRAHGRGHGLGILLRNLSGEDLLEE